MNGELSNLTSPKGVHRRDPARGEEWEVQEEDEGKKSHCLLASAVPYFQNPSFNAAPRVRDGKVKRRERGKRTHGHYYLPHLRL